MKRVSMLAALAVALSATGIAAAQAPKLKTDVFFGTSFPVTSVLVSGEKDAILIDAQFTLSDAHRLAGMILDSKKNLTTIYVTHGHPDHYFGAGVLKQTFPDVKIVALPEAVEGIKNSWKARMDFWRPQYGNNIPTEVIIPEALTGNTLALEGQTLELHGKQYGDGPNNSYVWIPSIKTIAAGDIVFSGGHFNVPANDASREAWTKTLNEMAAFQPVDVISGHRPVGGKADGSILTFMVNYMRDFTAAKASSKTAAELKDKVLKLYPNLTNENTLNTASEAAFRPPGAPGAPRTPPGAPPAPAPAGRPQ
jgi:glyoxylase-like metal-dependent hydrolase (beta-lactamase superfamily II)